MSASGLYHGFGIRGYQYERTVYAEGGVMFLISQARFNQQVRTLIHE